MTKTLSLLLMLCSIFVQTAKAQRAFQTSYHHKVNRTELTPASSPEEVVDFLVRDNGRDCSLMPGVTPKLFAMGPDKYGNIHAKYYMENDEGQATYYQLYLHFHPDGTLYYINGVLPLIDQSAPAMSKSAGKKIPAEHASLIATGNTTSEVSQTVVNYKDEPRQVYKVKDAGALQDVYVDVYSGEILYTIPHLLSFAPWSDVQGTNVKVQGNTMFYGMQSMDVMQTASGYILRDPVRNIITVDATDKYKDLPEKDIPGEAEQVMMLATGSDDFFFNEEQLQTAQYATAVRSIYLKCIPTDPAKGMPSSTSIRAYYSDVDHNSLGEIFNVNNATWTETDLGVYECMVSFPEPVSIDLLHTHHTVEITIDGEKYVDTDIIAAGDDGLYQIRTPDDSPITLRYRIDVATDAMQPALDIHWGVQKAYDMYDTYFGVKGSDGEGCQLVNIVNPTNNFPLIGNTYFPYNACALNVPLPDPYNNKTFYMLYGMGGVIADIKPNVELPIIAHEYTHTITAGCGGGLMPQNEPGALNESTADCMAMVVEDFALGKPSWKNGGQISIYNANMRDLKDPWYSGSADGKINEESAQPKYYNGRYWFDYNADPKTDNGGMHKNNGVFNYLFYLLCEGANNITNEVGQTHTIEAIGMEAMKDILFHSMVFYNSSMCNYTEIADNLMVAIEDIAQQDNAAIAKLQETMAIAFEHVGMNTSFSPTGITNVSPDTKSPYSGTYNLYGMPVDDNYKGIVIKNGKKMIQRR